MMWPTMIVDNFLDHPEEVRDEALKGKYTTDPRGAWPGKRCFDKKDLNEYLLARICRIIHPHEAADGTYNVNIDPAFQLIDSSSNGNGWIHSDAGHEITAIIYLTKNLPNCGTSFFRPKDFSTKIKDEDVKRNYYTKKENPQKYEEALKRNHDDFIETAYIDSVFNRLLLFDASQVHGVRNFNISADNPRLTFVVFLRYFFGPQLKSPIVESKRLY